MAFSGRVPREMDWRLRMYHLGLAMEAAISEVKSYQTERSLPTKIGRLPLTATFQPRRCFHVKTLFLRVLFRGWLVGCFANWNYAPDSLALQSPGLAMNRAAWLVHWLSRAMNPLYRTIGLPTPHHCTLSTLYIVPLYPLLRTIVPRTSHHCTPRTAPLCTKILCSLWAPGATVVAQPLRNDAFPFQACCVVCLQDDPNKT